MSNKRARNYMVCIALVQILFFVTIVFFAKILDPGFSFFRTTSYEEWNWLLDQPESILHENQVYMVIVCLRDVLFVSIVICFITYYWKHHLQISSISIPIIGLALYAPIFYHIKYVAEHYYLWMSLIPMEIASLILACLLLFARKRNETTGGAESLTPPPELTPPFPNSVIFLGTDGRKSEISKIEMKELFEMKKDRYIKFVRAARNRILQGSGAFLTALAVIFAAAPCSAHFYEPEVPRKLR